jgi:hypothetical protein
MEEKRKKDLPKEEALKFGALGAPLTVDVHQYVALAHGLNVEEAIREEEESNSSSRQLVSSCHRQNSSPKLTY